MPKGVQTKSRWTTNITNPPNHIWSIDFAHDKLRNGRSYKMLTVLDEYTREALCVAVKPKMNSADVGMRSTHPYCGKGNQNTSGPIMARISLRQHCKTA